MRPGVWFAPTVIETISYYPTGWEEVARVEHMLAENPFIGRQYVEGVSAIRALDKLWGDGKERQGPFIPTLTWVYGFAPFADLSADGQDQIFVLQLGSASMKRQITRYDDECSEIEAGIREIYEAVKASSSI